ncbi:PAQR family membrane homeostasis protein TrhA [Brachybacterium sacelli]|uniref:Hemolysin III n=1 Tax=Brachybacterium sacelli TaxID=173364 RepID=A0ABS4X4J9_9MICO|nr:hemolysin III family protein [Brachybacterium sacelli]MBP2383261.1 hemolysin III [Brachybacterium sacelli]
MNTGSRRESGASSPDPSPDRVPASAPGNPASSSESRDPALQEAVEAVAESGEPRSAADEDIPTADDYPFAPRTLTRSMAVRARQLGLQLPKPRLRGVLHLIAFPTSLVVGLLLIAVGETLAIRLACAVFVLTAGLLFGVSAVYHRGTWSPQRAIMLRRFDHANIFLIIAGTYTPIAATLLAPRQAITLLSIAWGGALIGVCFRLFWTGAPRWLYVPAYIALGWVAVFYMPALHATGGWSVVWLLVLGGLAYTVGAVVYALKRPNPSPAWFGFHEIFHAGTLIGFGCHFAAVATAVL